MRFASTFLTTIALTLCAGSALATPTIALTPTTPLVTRVASDGKTTYGCPERYTQTNSCLVDGTSQGVGYHDCVADTELEFSIAMTGVPDSGYNLQIWAGTGDCTQSGATNNASTGICWQVAASPTMATVISPFHIRVADLVRYINVTPPPQSFSPSDALTACNAARSQSSTTVVTDDSGASTSTAGVTTVTIYFLVFANGAATPTAQATYPVKVKLAGPNACTNVAAGAGDGELVVTWTPPSGDTSVQGFDLFAAPDGSTTSLLDASVTTCNDASVELFDDAGNPILDDAGNPIFVPGDGGCTTTGPTANSCGGTPSIDVSGITCSVNGDAGTVNANGGVCDVIGGVTSNKGTITGLTNGTQYTAAVAAFDQYGNTGVISTAVCSTPAPINDFWTEYNKAGGNAFCALAFVGSRGGAVAAALVGIVGIIFVRRRRKR
jgi:hypothetical protein